jgi:hypothetical protein
MVYPADWKVGKRMLLKSSNLLAFHRKTDGSEEAISF